MESRLRASSGTSSLSGQTTKPFQKAESFEPLAINEEELDSATDLADDF